MIVPVLIQHEDNIQQVVSHVHFNTLKYTVYESTAVFQNNLKVETLAGSYPEYSVKSENYNF